jgi:hypothetical protein
MKSKIPNEPLAKCRWISKTEMVAGYAALTAFYLGILAALSFVLWG